MKGGARLPSPILFPPERKFAVEKVGWTEKEVDKFQRTLTSGVREKVAMLVKMYDGWSQEDSEKEDETVGVPASPRSASSQMTLPPQITTKSALPSRILLTGPILFPNKASLSSLFLFLKRGRGCLRRDLRLQRAGGPNRRKNRAA